MVIGRRQKSVSRRVQRSSMHRWSWQNCKNTRKMQIRVICCGPRNLLQNSHFSRPVKPSLFISTRPTPTLLRPISPQHLTPNRKKGSSSSSVRTGTSLHGNLLTCQVYPGGWLSTVCESTQRQNLSRNICDGPPSRKGRLLAKRWLGS